MNQLFDKAFTAALDSDCLFLLMSITVVLWSIVGIVLLLYVPAISLAMCFLLTWAAWRVVRYDRR